VSDGPFRRYNYVLSSDLYILLSQYGIITYTLTYTQMHKPNHSIDSPFTDAPRLICCGQSYERNRHARRSNSNDVALCFAGRG
jgi:hypothetical protein